MLLLTTRDWLTLGSGLPVSWANFSLNLSYGLLISADLKIKMGKRVGEKLPLQRIKKLMQANKEIGKIQRTTPYFMAMALEAFVQEITEKSAELSEQNQDTKILPSHIKEIILRNPDSFGFLKGLVSSVPDFEVNTRLDD